MKLDRAWIQRYGPLQADVEFAEGITILRGPNESGKTLLVEALLKCLGGTDAISEPRVAEQPEGFVTATDGSDEVKITPGDTLLEYYAEAYDYDLTTAELRNIFVIRDADLQIPAEDRFYERVTDRITGIRTQDVRQIKAELREAGRLTKDRLDISNADGHDDAQEQLETARDLRADIEEYVANNESAADLESQLLAARLEKDDLETEEARLQRAKAKREFEQLRESKATIEANLDALADLPEEAAFADLAHRVGQFTAGERDELEARRDRFSRLALGAVGGGVVAFGLVLVAGAPVVSFAVPVLAFALAGYALYTARSASSSVAAIDSERADLLAEAQRLGIDVETLGDLRAEVERIERERAQLRGEINEESGILKTELNIRAEDPEAVVEAADKALAARARDIDTDVEREFDAAALEEVQGKLAAVEREIDDLDDRLSDHRAALRRFSNRAGQLNFKAFTGDPLDLRVRNLDALRRLADRLDELMTAIETDAAVSRAAHRVFDRLEAAEESKVSELFGGDSRAAELFCTLTGDRYAEVRYDHEADQLLVERPNGQALSPTQLSNGTRDQLYLSIRVALAERLPDVSEGFFLMDDAFLAADPERMARQADLLASLAGRGWQVIYLTAQPDAIEALRPHADGPVVELDPLP